MKNKKDLIKIIEFFENGAYYVELNKDLEKNDIKKLNKEIEKAYNNYLKKSINTYKLETI